MNKLTKNSKTRLDEYLKSDYVIDTLKNNSVQLSDNDLNEMLLFFDKWIPQRNNKDSKVKKYNKLINLLLVYKSDLFNRYVEYNSYKPHTLNHYVFLYGAKEGTIRYENSLTSRKKQRIVTFEQIIESFFKRKMALDSEYNYDMFTDDQLMKIYSILKYDNDIGFRNNDRTLGILDIVYHNTFDSNEEILERYIKCFKYKFVKLDHLILRYGEVKGNEKFNEITQRNKDNSKLTFKSNKEYWIFRGFTEEQAVEEVSKYQSHVSSFTKNYNSQYSLQYWMNKGYSEEESKNKISNLQSRNIDFFIDKFGEDEGKNRYDLMINKRSETFYSKTEEERALINSSRGRTFDELVITHGREKATSIIHSRTVDFAGSSNEASLFLSELESKFEEKDKEFIFYNGNKNKEFFIRTKEKSFLLDFKFKNKVIEYHGDFWHCNPEIYEDDYIHPVTKKTAKEMRKQDSERIEILNQLGFDVKIVWSSDVVDDEDRKNIIKECMEFLNGKHKSTN